jgi:hypothetical protein
MTDSILEGSRVRARRTLPAPPIEPDSRVLSFLMVSKGSVGTVDGNHPEESGMYIVSLPFGDDASAPIKVGIYSELLEVVKP